MRRAVAPLLALALAAAVGFAVWQGQRSERAIGALGAERDAAIAREGRAMARGDSLARARRRVDTVAGRLITRWDTLYAELRDTLRLVDTIPVPVEVIITADSAIRACREIVSICDQQLEAERAVTAAVRDQLGATTQLLRRPWTSVGLDYDGRWGAYLDRDWWRFRVGLSVTPAPQDARVGIRLGVRW